MRWYRDISEILRQEPETWLDYFHGQHLKDMPRYTQHIRRFRGVFRQLLSWFYFLLCHMSLRRCPYLNDRHYRYIAYARSINQMNSLDSTIDALRSRGEKVLAMAPITFLNTQQRKARYVGFNFGLFDTLKAIILLITRACKLQRTLKSKHPAAIGWFLSSFWSTYIYLVYFYELLKEAKPECVIISNDHNLSKRCMLAVAHYLGIKTVYIQHASVSSLFPALRVNYAFLDGQSALDIYRTCEANQPEWQRNVPVPKIFLTGQKKSIPLVAICDTCNVGLAINSMDAPDKVIELVQSLIDAGFTICFRWHPGLPIEQINKYKVTFTGKKQVRLSNPVIEHVGEFIAGLGYLIAGNSSIHLEAAVAGIQTIYYELTPAHIPDYYGYVKHGLAKEANSPKDLIGIIKNNNKGQKGLPAVNAVRYYSATYKTEWHGREGELVAESLIRLAKGEPAQIMFGYMDWQTL